MPDMLAIDDDSIVNDVISQYPVTVGVFNYFGIDACCGGDLTVAEAAMNDFVDPEVVVESLRSAIQHDRLVGAR
jgi:regulator of cell morphogenesis and NO signaling